MAFSLQEFLRSDRLPTLPEVAVRVLDVVRNPDPDLDALADAVRMDPAIAARLLKVANSALMGMKSPASSIEAAVARLGSTTVRTVILGLCLSNYEDRRSLEQRPWFRRIWRQMLFQAVTADALAEHQPSKVDAADWFLAGFIQDIGRLAMLTVAGQEYMDHVLDKKDTRSELQREREHFGFTHVDVMVALCKRWNFESSMIDAMAVHHDLPHTIAPLRFASSNQMAVGLITASNCAEYMEQIGTDLTQCRKQVERLLMQVFALQPDQISRLLSEIDERIGEFAVLFHIDIGDLPSRHEILAEAEEILEQIALEQKMRYAAPSSAEAPRPGKGAASLACAAPRWRDELTGLFNQEYLHEGCPQLQDSSESERVAIGTMMIRLNGLETLRSLHGDTAADHVVKLIALVLQRSVRISDCTVRSGVDSFTIVMADVNLDMMLLMADQLCCKIVELCQDRPGWEGITGNIGVLLHLPATKPMKADALLAATERALIDATHQGPNSRCVVVVQNGKVLAANAFAHQLHSADPATL